MASSLSKRVAHRQTGKTGEVAVERQELAYAVLDRKSGDVRVVNEVSDGLSRLDRPSQVRPMLRALAEQHEGGRSEQRLEVFEGGRERGRRVEDARMSDDAKKLVDAGPRQSPRLVSFRERL
jgi:hypothetical protein